MGSKLIRDIFAEAKKIVDLNPNNKRHAVAIEEMAVSIGMSAAALHQLRINGTKAADAPQLGKYMGYAMDVTLYTQDEILDRLGENTRVYSTYLYDSGRKVHVADTNASYELWFVGTHITPGKDDLSDEDREYLADKEIEMDAENEQVIYIYQRDLKGAVVLGDLPEMEDDETEDEWYLRGMGEMLESMQGNSGPEEIVRLSTR